MPKVFTSKSQRKGELGEDLACRFLMKHGYEVVERNYTRRLGEIDIVAKKDKKLYFIEVKSVSFYTTIRPEENMHPMKLKKIYRTIELYIEEKNLKDIDWQLDLVCVLLDEVGKKAKFRIIENIV